MTAFYVAFFHLVLFMCNIKVMAYINDLIALLSRVCYIWSNMLILHFSASIQSNINNMHFSCFIFHVMIMVWEYNLMVIEGNDKQMDMLCNNCSCLVNKLFHQWLDVVML